MTIDLTLFMKAVFTLVAVLITGYLIPWLKSKTTVEQQQEINTWVKIGVQAAEQLFVGSGRGAEKKAYVMEYLQQKGFRVDATELDKMIEATVLALNKGVL